MPLSPLSRLSRLTAPTYKLSVNGSLSSQTLRDRLVSLSVTLNNGRSSDQLSMTFDDRPTRFGGGIRLPRQGVTIDISMGYETYLAQMGSFEVNNVSLNGSGGGRTITVSATPSLLLTETSRTWAGKTIGNIVKTIAGEHGLTAKVSPKFSNPLETIDVVNQSNQSDLDFLTRLAERNDAVCKPMAGNLLFMEKGQGTSASGLPMLPVKIKPHDILQWSTQLSERQDYTKVIAYWPDLEEAEYKEAEYPTFAITTMSSEKTHRIPHPFNTEAEAKAVAKAKFNELNRGDATLNMTLIGDPDITAEGKITVSGLRNSVNGDYIVKSVTHSFSSGGYQTSLNAYVEN